MHKVPSPDFQLGLGAVVGWQPYPRFFVEMLIPLVGETLPRVSRFFKVGKNINIILMSPMDQLFSYQIGIAISLSTW